MKQTRLLKTRSAADVIVFSKSLDGSRKKWSNPQAGWGPGHLAPNHAHGVIIIIHHRRGA